jgi:hypothetical protein
MIQVITEMGLSDVVSQSVFDSFYERETDWMIKYGVEYVLDVED